MSEGTVAARGYVIRWSKEKGGLVYVHCELAEKALGKPLPKGARVHHINGISDDNRHENLVVCPD